MESPGRRLLISIVLLLAAHRLDAYRREYRVTLEDERKPGSEVCFFRGETPADVFSLFFSHDRVTCMSADDVLDMPPGLFHVFARHADGYVSAYRDYFVYRGPPAPEKGYELLEIPLEKAAYADFSALTGTLANGQSVGVWLAPTAATSGIYFPLVNGETTIMVSADTSFVPLLIRGDAPVAIGDPLRLKAGERRAVPQFSRDRTRRDVVAWLRLDPDPALQASATLPLPEITLVAEGQPIQPVFPILDALASSHTLLFFSGVPAGPAEVRVRGKTWIHSDTKLIVREGTTVVREPVMLAPGAALTVSWGAGSQAPPELEPCPASKEPRAQVRATVSRCPPEGACRKVAANTAAFQPAGSLVFEGLPAAEYQLAFETSFAKPRSFPVKLVVGEDSSLPVPIEGFSFFGTVRLNGAPVRAELLFETGGSQTDEAGKYTAVLGADPKITLIRIVVCSDGRVLTHLIHERIRPNSAYDMDLRFGKLTVNVTDAGNDPVPEAETWFVAVRKVDEEGIYGSQRQVTDTHGKATFHNTPSDLSLRICASHREYLQKCTDVLRPDQLTSGKAVIQLDRGLMGKVIGHDGFGFLAWVDSTGTMTEQVAVSTDGTFSFKSQHRPDEYIVYTSNRRPLLTLPMPRDREGDLMLTLPSAPARTFTVTVPPLTGWGWVGLWIGERYIPLQMLANHQDPRGHDIRVRGDRPLVMQDIGETAPLAVAIRPNPAVEGTGPFIDPFTLPEYASLARFRVTSATVAINP